MSDTGAALATNDAVVTDDQVSTNPPADAGADEGGAPELDDDGNPVIKDETEELEWDGKKWVLPKDAVATLKPALLRQGDYTKKTQEIADARRAQEARENEFKAHTEAQKAHFQAATKLAALDEQIAPYAKMTPQDWINLRAQNPDAYQDHWVNYDFLKNQRDAAFRDFSQREQERQSNAQRESAKQLADAYAAIERFVPEWKPNSEFESKIFSYGNELGLKTDVLARAIIQEPIFARELARLHAYDEAAKKQKTQQAVEKTLETKPVTRVGGAGGSANQRKTTDSSGDALSTEEWIRRENERVAKQRQAAGRR